jgi:Flp pilus assembly secretin CpaC
MIIAAPTRRFSFPRSSGAPPLRMTPALCGVLAALSCLWLAPGAAVRAEEHATLPTPIVKTSSSVSVIGVPDAAQGALLNMRIGRSLSLPLASGARYAFSGDVALVKAEVRGERLVLTALGAGHVELTITPPAASGAAAAPLQYSLRIADANGKYHDSPDAMDRLEQIFGGEGAVASNGGGQAVVTSGAPGMRVPSRQPALTTTATDVDDAVAGAPSLGEAVRPFVPVSRPTTPLRTPRVAAESHNASSHRKKLARLPQKAAKMTVAPMHLVSVISANTAADLERQPVSTPTSPQIVSVAQIVPPLPGLEPMDKVPSSGGVATTPAYDPPRATANAAAAGSAPANAAATADATDTTVPTASDDTSVVVVTPNVASPTTLPASGTTYPTQSQLPPSLGDLATAKRPLYNVTQGMARLLAFKSNILSVFFSDDNVMDARAVNARTIAVTGKGPGKSTLAVFLSRYDGDVVGRAVIYNIQVYPTASRPSPVGFTDPAEAENAIRTALNDPRIRVGVLQRPDGSLVAQLAGGLRDRAEVDAAVATASLFVPNVISSLYVDPQALDLERAQNGPSLTGDALLQSKLRALLNNDTIEIVALPNSTALKATVATPADAEGILSILPSLSRRIQPFITVQGTPGFYDSEHPVLYGEDYEMTRRLHEVTKISTVYAVRTARNAVALYGTVRDRVEYDTVRRYAMTLLPELQENVMITPQTAPVAAGTNGVAQTTATTATTTSVAASAPQLATAAALAPAPVTGDQTGLKASTLPGSWPQAPVQIQMFVRIEDPAASSVRLVTVDTNIVEITRTALKDLGAQFGSASLLSETSDPTTGVLTRVVNPTINQGVFTAGNGFLGTGGFSNIDPIRARISALIQNGTARVLSRPNLTAVEGADAQITIGGSRPVPSIQSTSGGNTQNSSLEFRRYGIIITMRPTVTDDDTIILQIRTDVTDLDPTTGILFQGANIPGERVRSVDTTVTLHEGDTLVLGGLISNELRKDISKVPILGDIPLLGNLFRSKRFQNNQSELAIFLTPRLMRQRASVNTINGVGWIPSLPDLPSQQEEQQTAFGISTAGTGKSG